MNIFHKSIISAFLLLGVASYINPLSASENNYIAERGGGGGMGRSNEMYSGNRFDAGATGESNRMYSGNAADRTQGQFNHVNEGNVNNEFYRGVERGAEGAADLAPVAPYGYGSAPVAPSSQTESDALYWGEVQQMEKQ